MIRILQITEQKYILKIAPISSLLIRPAAFYNSWRNKKGSARITAKATRGTTRKLHKTKKTL